MSRRRLLIALPVVALLLLVGGPWLYINVIREDPPERLTLDDVTTTTATGEVTSTTGAVSQDGIEGAWTIGTGSVAGYRVQEVLFGQNAEAVGRTEGVTGTMTISGTTVIATEVTVDMTSIASSESQRDRQFQGRIMSTGQFPTATFVLTAPIELGAVPADGEKVTVSATGDLTLRGVTHSITLDLIAQRNGTTLAIDGSILIDFDEFEIPDASGGPAQVGREGELELLLVFSR